MFEVNKDIEFDINPVKSHKNKILHRFNFEDAKKVFYDSNRKEEYDPGHSEYEQRYLTIGRMDGKIVRVNYTVCGDKVRIITAREASKNEEMYYFTGKRREH